jgi:hypothetical protein
VTLRRRRTEFIPAACAPVTKILDHLGLESELPTFAAPRGPPLFAGLERWASQRRADVDGGRRVVADVDVVEPDYG